VAPPAFAPEDLDGAVDVLPTANGTPVLVRPDGYVGWSGVEVDDLRVALRTWGAVGPGQRAA
jgi:hypothetical protein